MLMGKDFIDELDGEYVSGLMGKSQNVGVHQAFAVGAANSPLHDMSFDSILEFHQTRGVLAKQKLEQKKRQGRDRQAPVHAQIDGLLVVGESLLLEQRRAQVSRSTRASGCRGRS